jgi:hypothetical protein
MADHPEVGKLYRNIQKFVDDEAAAEISRAAPLSAGAGDAEKAMWVTGISDGLERRFDEATIKSIRMGCHCDEEGRLPEMKQWLRGLYRESSSLAEFVGKVNRHGAGWYMEDGAIYTKFLTCECYMVQGVEHLDTKTWCYCTVGYTRGLFEHVFGQPVESELVQSIKMGSEYCLVKVTPK